MQAFIYLNFDSHCLVSENQNLTSENIGMWKVKYWPLIVSHFNQLINSKHLGKPQNVIAQDVYCSVFSIQAYSEKAEKMKKKWSRKTCFHHTETREDYQQNLFKIFRELHTERTEAWVSGSRATHTDNSKIVLLGLMREWTGHLLNGPKPPYKIKEKSAFNLENSLSLEEVWHRFHVAFSPVRNVRNQWWCEGGTMSATGVGSHSFLKSTVYTVVYQDILALHAPLCWQALWKCRSNLPAGHGTFPHCWKYKKLTRKLDNRVVYIYWVLSNEKTLHPTIQLLQ